MEILGIPKEIKSGETRVSLTPKGVKFLRFKKVRVLVEKGAGSASHFSDQDYENAGAQIISTPEELWKKSTFIKKVKEPIESEFKFLRKDLILFTFLHLASPRAASLVEALEKSETTALAYETLEVLGYTPILKPMSLIAGSLAGFLSGAYRNFVKVKDGKVIIDPSLNQVIEEFQEHFPALVRKLNPGKVVVLGGGQVGIKAAETSFIMGGEVSIYEINVRRCHYLKRYFDEKVKVTADWREIHADLASADVIISGVYVRAKRAPLLIDENLLAQISKTHAKLIIDVASDQGGNVYGSEPTLLSNPLYLDQWSNLRCGVSNLPSLLPQYASVALEESTLDYTFALCGGLKNGLMFYPELKTAFSVYRGKIVQPEVAEVHKHAFATLQELLSKAS